MEMTSGSDHVSVTSYQTSVTILPETTEEPTTTFKYPWTTESSSTAVPTSIATSSASQTSATGENTTTTGHSNPAVIIVPIIVVIFIIIVIVVLVIFLIRRRRRQLEAHRIPPPPMPGLDEVDRTRMSAVGGPGCEFRMDSIPSHGNGLNDYTEPPAVHHIDHAEHQREESTYVLQEDFNQTSAVAGTSGVLTSGVSTLGRNLKPAKTENVYQNSGFTGRVKDDAYYVNAARRSEIESVNSDDDDDGGEIVGLHLPRPTLSGGSVTPENPNGLRKNVCSIFPSSAGHIENSEAS